MYRCEKCGVVAPAGTPAHQMVIKKRAKVYPSRSRKVIQRRGYRSNETIDAGGEGFETAEELTVCPDCAAQGIEAVEVQAPPPIVEVVAEEAGTATEPTAKETAATAPAASDERD